MLLPSAELLTLLKTVVSDSNLTATVCFYIPNRKRRVLRTSKRVQRPALWPPSCSIYAPVRNRVSKPASSKSIVAVFGAIESTGIGKLAISSSASS